MGGDVKNIIIIFRDLLPDYKTIKSAPTQVKKYRFSRNDKFNMADKTTKSRHKKMAK